MTWEYMIQSHQYTEAELNEVGREGWELCGIENIGLDTPIINSSEYPKYFFKRAVG